MAAVGMVFPAFKADDKRKERMTALLIDASVEDVTGDGIRYRRPRWALLIGLFGRPGRQVLSQSSD